MEPASITQQIAPTAKPIPTGPTRTYTLSRRRVFLSWIVAFILGAFGSVFMFLWVITHVISKSDSGFQVFIIFMTFLTLGLIILSIKLFNDTIKAELTLGPEGITCTLPQSDNFANWGSVVRIGSLEVVYKSYKTGLLTYSGYQEYIQEQRKKNNIDPKAKIGVRDLRDFEPDPAFMGVVEIGAFQPDWQKENSEAGRIIKHYAPWVYWDSVAEDNLTDISDTNPRPISIWTLIIPEVLIYVMTFGYLLFFR